MAIKPLKDIVERLKTRLKKNEKPSLVNKVNLRLPDDLNNAINSLVSSSLGNGRKSPDIIREALEIYFFYDLFLGNIEEKISPTDDRFDRLESLIKDSFQMAFGRGKTSNPIDFTIMDILLSLIAQQSVKDMTSDQIQNQFFDCRYILRIRGIDKVIIEIDHQTPNPPIFTNLN